MKKEPTAPFLRQVADAYLDLCAQDTALPLIDVCFVTPNKRSALFLSRHFSEAMRGRGVSGLLPAATTISDFIDRWSDGVQASPLEGLFMLYGAYRDVMLGHITEEDAGRPETARLIDFNRFQRWGDVLLNDFNDVDRDLVDASQLFRNIKNLREISANYLTPEQIEIIRQYWDTERLAGPEADFWLHAVHTNSKAPRQKEKVAAFVHLWQALFEIYTEFRSRLRAAGLHYAGMAAREAAERIATAEPEAHPYRRYVFVGFFALSNAERRIFETLQRQGIADFYWDDGSPLFRRNGPSGRIIRHNLRDFPPLVQGVGSATGEYPEVEVISVPSTVGQAKLLPSLLERLHPEAFGDMADEDASDDSAADPFASTALVLPEEEMIHSVLDALPREVEAVNVTMGLSLRHTPIAGLMRNIVSLQMRARLQREQATFFHEDVEAVLSHPLMREGWPREADEVVRRINADRLFNVPVALFDEEPLTVLRPLFSMVDNLNEANGVLTYFDRLLDMLEVAVDKSCPAATPPDAEEQEDPEEQEDVEKQEDDEAEEEVSTDTFRLQRLFLDSYRAGLHELRRLLGRYLHDAELTDSTLFQLVERIVGNLTVSYEGKPLRGLQVMGVLETRALDIDNIIMLSMNERIFPRRQFSRSFIPDAIRRAYRMPTPELQESIFSYYFFRLLARAKRVFLLYDGRTAGVKTGTPSRYISQIKYLFPPEKVRMLVASYRLESKTTSPISIPKSPRVMKRLEKYLAGKGNKSLSATSINRYINCPLEFYLCTLEGYKEQDELRDYLNDADFGTIVHEVAERLYTEARGDREELPLTPELLRTFDERTIQRHATAAIRKYYLNVAEDDARPLHGDAVVYRDMVTHIIRTILRCEAKMPGISFIKGEKPDTVAYPVGDGRYINLTHKIDRVDRLRFSDGSEAIRLVDYKTGNDPLTAANVDAMFDGGDKRPKAMLQLMLYCQAYAIQEGYKGAIQPYIYSVRNLTSAGLPPLTIDKRKVMDYRDFEPRFNERIQALLREILDPEIPFTAKPEGKHCQYCNFTNICHVNNT